MKVWALVSVFVVVVGFALLCFALLCFACSFKPIFIKRRSRGVMVSTQMDLKSPLFSSRVGVMQPSLGTMSTFLGGWLQLLFAGTFKV